MTRPGTRDETVPGHLGRAGPEDCKCQSCIGNAKKGQATPYRVSRNRKTASRTETKSTSFPRATD